MLGKIAVLATTWLVSTALAAAGELPGAEQPDAAIAASGAAVPELARDAPAPFAQLAWIDPASAALGTEAVVRPEVTRLLREMGVAARWRRAEPSELARPGELRVIFLDRGARRAHDVPVLGATPTSFQGERFVWVHVPSVRAAVGIGGSRSGPSLDVHSTRRLGIAIARVIAHEVVHALAPALPHGRGLMAARLDQRMLTAPRVPVEPEIGLAVRRALALPPPVAAPGDAAILAAESGEPWR